MSVMEPWAYDYTTCPKRDDKGTHHKGSDSLVCIYCGIRVISMKTPTETTSGIIIGEAPPQDDKEPARRGDWTWTRVPPYLRPEYIAARNKGFDDEYAHGYVAQQHGLEPVGRDTWTLRQLAKLEFLKWLAARESHES